MTIIEEQYAWSRALVNRSKTTLCVIHHEAGHGMTAQQIHKMHRDQNGWAGIGYHFYIRSDGKIYRGRPIKTVGTHTANYNATSVGVCFEGNFEYDELTKAQFKSGVELLTYINELYPEIKFLRHKDLNATACPGARFPFDSMIEEVKANNMSGEEIATRLAEYYASKNNSWSEEEIKEAVELGLTDGSNLDMPCSRRECIVLALRAYKKGRASK